MICQMIAVQESGEGEDWGSARRTTTEEGIKSSVQKVPERLRASPLRKKSAGRRSEDSIVAGNRAGEYLLLPSESSRRAMSCAAPLVANHHDSVVIVDNPAPDFQRIRCCWDAQFSRKTVHHFHFCVTCTHCAELSFNMRETLPIDISKP